VRWIDSAVRVSQDLHYLPVRVDAGSGKVIGLPYQWQHLTPVIVEEVRERRDEFEADPAFQAELQRLMQGSTQTAADDTLVARFGFPPVQPAAVAVPSARH
jgi:hypothetical protein